jgi:hypothetical protein
MTITNERQQLQTMQLDVSNTTLHHSPEELEQLRHDNPHLQIELTEDGKLIVVDREPGTNGKYTLPPLTAEEISQKVEALQRYQARRQKIIDNLTQEELEISNQQFDDMFKSIEHSRS